MASEQIDDEQLEALRASERELRALDPALAYRRPLTVLVVLLPLAILAETYRLVAGRSATLLFDEQWTLIGNTIGLTMPTLVPAVVLTVACLALHVFRRHPWLWPSGSEVLRMLGWGVVWAVVSYCLHFTTWQLTDPMPVGAGPGGSHYQLADLGLAFSGALQEEMVFRGLLLGTLMLVLRGLGFPTLTWYALALPISAVLFSLAHTEVVNHTAGAEPFNYAVFVQRGVAGALYGLVFIRQGLAVATLAHGLYNIAVLWRLGPWF